MARIGSYSPSSSPVVRVANRELNGLRGSTRPWFSNLSAGMNDMALDLNGQHEIPFAVSFCNEIENSHLLACSGEDGFLRIFDTRNFPPSIFSTGKRKGAKAREWIAHKNAVFDLCWIKGGMCILTASGDQTIKAWDPETNECIGTMNGHSGSVKSVSAHPSNSDCFVSGSRDGSFMLWDLRQNQFPRRQISSIAEVMNAHTSPKMKRRKMAACTSITSVLYLKDGVSIATGGAADSVVKFWDTRNLKTPITKGCPFNGEMMDLQHGISSMSQDLNGANLAVSCMDNCIYLYDVLNLDKGPKKIFTGCEMNSFYIKSCISPDAAHILSGSTDGNAYLWQIQGSESSPFKFSGHECEITAVDWSPSDFGKFATSSEDLTVRFWELREGNCQNRSPTSSTRKRVTAYPYTESTSPNQSSPSGFSTPEPLKKRRSEEIEEVHKTPETSSFSPSSVLNPPSSSSKKTIKDYFLAAPSISDSNRRLQ